MNSSLSVEDLLREVSPENPCGEALEYDPDFVAMEQASQAKEERKVGDSVIPAEEADWQTVKGKALALFGRTKDLRVAVYLTRSLVPIDGAVGLLDGLKLILGLMERYWDDVHPRLDPEDNNDPTLRVNTLQNLFGQETMLRPVREMELVETKGVGRFSFRDVLVAEGKMPAPEEPDAPIPGLAEIEAAFMGCDLEDLQRKAEAVKTSIGTVESIESTLTEKVGHTQAVGFSPIAELLKELSSFLSAQLVRRGVGVPEDEAARAAATSAIGEINTREDVVRALDKATDYFRRNEPSSPVPLLLKRAKKLLSKDFLEIVRDLAPSGVQEVEKIRGPDSD
jgi:type VI secretion system protein ImpA